MKTLIYLLLLFYFILMVKCVPTSVLIKDNTLMENKQKVKRSSNLSPIGSELKNNNENTFDLEIPLTSSLSIEKPKSIKNNNNNNNIDGYSTSSSEVNNNNQLTSIDDRRTDKITLIKTNEKSPPHKRGINSKLFNVGSDLYQQPNGMWNDDIDSAINNNMYSDLQDFSDDYPKGPYHQAKYDNLQNILGSDLYQEPYALAAQYPSRYYMNDERKKRSNNYDLRLKRESNKLTPADMLALVALVEAGERANYENEDDLPYFVPLEQQQQQNYDMLNGWQQDNEPSGYWYDVPYNLDNIPRYEIVRDQQQPKFNSNRYQSKRFMVSKKKRSINQFLNKPISMKQRPASSLVPSKSLQKFL